MALGRGEEGPKLKGLEDLMDSLALTRRTFCDIKSL